MRNITDYTPAINKMTDLTQEELAKRKNGNRQFKTPTSAQRRKVATSLAAA